MKWQKKNKMKNLTFIIKTNKPVKESDAELLVQVVTAFTSQYNMYLDDTLEYPIKPKHKQKRR